MQFEVDSDLEQDFVVKLKNEAQNSCQLDEIIGGYQSLVSHKDKLEEVYEDLSQKTSELADENNSLKAALQQTKSGAKRGYLAEQFEQKSVQLQEQRRIALQKHAETLQQLVRCRQKVEKKQNETDDLADTLEQSYTQNQILKQQLEDLKKQLHDKRLTRKVNSTDLQEHIQQQETAEQWVHELKIQKNTLERQMVEMVDTIAQKRSSLNAEMDDVWSMQMELQAVQRKVTGKKLTYRLKKFSSLRGLGKAK